MKRKIFLKTVAALIVSVLFVLLVFSCGEEKLKEGETFCQECGKHFKIGTGYNTDGYNQYGPPDNEYSHFCSPECAYKDVQKKK